MKTKRKPGPKPGSKRTKRNEQLRDRLIDGTVAGLRAKAVPLELYEYLATLAGVPNADLCQPETKDENDAND
jgi:hypothetical protein